MNRHNITKRLSIGIALMGAIHIVTTFTPLIADKLSLLPDGTQNAFTYFSLMCGTLLILCGIMLYTLSGKVETYPFIRTPYMITVAVTIADGILAVCYMPHNPFAWIVFILTMGVMSANIARGIIDKNKRL